MKQILTANNKLDAYQVDYFPYTHGQFCKARFWVETKDNYGQRVCYQLNPFDSNGIEKGWQPTKYMKYASLVIFSIYNCGNAYAGLPNFEYINFDEESMEDLWDLLNGNSYELTDIQKSLIMGMISYRTKYGL